MRSVRLGNVVASLSHAMDLVEGQVAGHSVRTCAIGMAVAEDLGMPPEQRSDLYYALLLKDAGCSANASGVADAFGSDDHAIKWDMKTTNWSNWLGAAAYLGRNAGMGRGLGAKVRHFLILARGGGPLAREFTRLRCERGADIALGLGFSPRTADAIRALDEHWDGAGHPYGIAGGDIPVEARIACLAQTTEVFVQRYGVSSALEMVRSRRGSWFDPELADVVLGWAHRSDWWERVRGMSDGEDIRAVEPRDHVRSVGEDGLDRIAEAFADVIDAKSPYTSDHSKGVARVARKLARRLGGSTGAERRLYRAGLLHDIGKVAISNRILDKPGRLTDAEFAEVRRHPRYSRDILVRVDAFRDVLDAACLHHERLDGSGYPWGLNADRLDRDARIVAVADVFEALTAHRPYRESLGPDEVRRLMMQDAGRALDGEVLDVLFASADIVEGAASRPLLAAV